MNSFYSPNVIEHQGLIKISQSFHGSVTVGNYLSYLLDITLNTKTNNSHKLIVYPLRSLT